MKDLYTGEDRGVTAHDLGVSQPGMTFGDMMSLAKEGTNNVADWLAKGNEPEKPLVIDDWGAKGPPPANAASGTGVPSSDMPNSAPLAAPGQPGAAPMYPPARSIEPGDIDPATGKMTAQGMLKFGTSGVSPQAMDLATSAWKTANANVAQEQGAIKDAIGDVNVAGANREEAARLKLSTDMAKNAELAPIYAQRTALDKKNASEMNELYTTATQETTAQMVRVRQAANDAANAQVKDFWADRSTAGRIMGVISQALAGAANGLSGQPGAPTPLDHIINRDLEMQRMNLNNKNVAAQREEGILGTMQRQFNNNMQAHGAAYIAAVGVTDTMAKQVAQKYATPEAMAAYQQFHADNLEKVAAATSQLHGSLLSSNLQQAATAGQILERQTAANAAAAAAAAKGKEGKAPNHIMGIKGEVNNLQFNALQEHSQATASALDAYQEIQAMMKDKDHIDPAWIQKFNDLASRAFAARRIDQKTGARLEGPELDRINAGVPKLSEGFLGRFTRDKDILSINKMLGNMIATETGQYSARVRSVTGMDLDYNDPLIGRHLRAIAKPGLVE